MTRWFGIPGLLVVMIAAALQRNISLSVNNDREVLHYGISKTIIRQILMVAVIATSHFVLTDFIYSQNLSVFGWCVYGFIVFIGEALFCGVIWIATDRKLSQNAFKYLKDKVKR